MTSGDITTEKRLKEGGANKPCATNALQLLSNYPPMYSASYFNSAADDEEIISCSVFPLGIVQVFLYACHTPMFLTKKAKYRICIHCKN